MAKAGLSAMHSGAVRRALILLALLLGHAAPLSAVELQGWWRAAEPGEQLADVAIDDPRWQRFAPDTLSRFVPDGLPAADRRSWLMLRPAAGKTWPQDTPTLRVQGAVLQWLSVQLPGEPLRRARLLNPVESGEVAHGVTAWPLQSLAGGRQPLLIGLDSRNVLPASLRFEIVSITEHRQRDARWLAFASAMLAVMLSMGLMALVFAVYLRDGTFLYYAGYNVSYAGILALQSGFAAAPLGILFESEGGPISGRLLTAASICFAVLFVDRFVDLRRHAPKMRWLLAALGGGVILSSSLSLVPVPEVADVGRSLTNPLLILGGPAVIAAAVVAALRGSGYAVIFLIGWLPLLAVTVLGSLQLFGLFGSWHWLSSAGLAAGAFEALVLSLGLARRSLDLRRERDAVRALADLDPLTGLLNRRAWARRVDLLRQSGRDPICLLFIDVDHFKTLNDQFGHEAGDSALNRLAGQLKAELRNEDVLARHGGEELLAALPDCSPERAAMIAERIRTQIALLDFSPHNDQPHEPLHLTVSIGIAVLRDDEPLDRLVDRADQAMYKAKAAGRNRVEMIA